jgi:hypothetical protein
VTWFSWRRKDDQQAQDAKRLRAERLRDRAEDQQKRAEELAPRVDAITSSLRKLHTDNHFGPMIDNALRGSE